MSIIDISEVLLDLGLSESATDIEKAVANSAIIRAEGAISRVLRYDPVYRQRTEYYPQQNYDSQSRAAIYEVSDTQAYLRGSSEAVAEELQVKHLPVRSSPAIDLRIDYDGRSESRALSFGASTVKVEGTDFHPNYTSWDASGNSVCLDGLFRSQGSWPTSAGSVRILYYAGYTPDEFRGVSELAVGATPGSTPLSAVPIWEATLDETVRRAKKVFVSMKKTGVGFAAGPLASERLGDYAYTIGQSSIDKLFGGTSDVTDDNLMKLQDFVNFGIVMAS